MSDDPYVHHAVTLAYGATREELAAKLRAMADHIASGGGDIVTRGAAGVLLVKQHDPSGGEEAMHQRMHMVFATAGDGADPAIAMFNSRDFADRFIDGRPILDEGESWGVDMAIARVDLMGSWWNSVDPDPTEVGAR